MSDQSDLDLVRRCQSSDPAVADLAFRELYELHQERVFNTALRVLGNPADAADVTQEVFLTLFRKLGEFQGNSRLSTWVYRITVNLSIDRKRRTGSAPAIVSEGNTDGFLLDLLPDEDGAGPTQGADHEFVERKVQSAIGRLSPKLRAIVVLRYVEGLAYSEIADVMDCSIGTVKSRLNRAHGNLEGLLKPVLDSISGREEA